MGKGSSIVLNFRSDLEDGSCDPISMSSINVARDGVALRRHMSVGTGLTVEVTFLISNADHQWRSPQVPPMVNGQEVISAFRLLDVSGLIAIVL